MLIIFKSKVTGEIVMYKEHVANLFRLLEKNLERGVITAAETNHVIKTIEQLIDEDKQQRKTIAQNEEDDLSDYEKKQQNSVVTLSARMYPLLEMLRMANKKQADILWGV
ncbi:DUF1840 domain-containing protein [Undibacterium fentianense]|uniref:DUF1840 domain-containing protein n=1 Tax=Undibacterium fentianense TaxID=2828728 RepID=A0A941IFD8_9BURK|nr:DUF1840 domain-containing protein [Undibacterium fentianense]MBR7800611.1 DUF1840 domain-containing protein [Undibacterium fentianense]